MSAALLLLASTEIGVISRYGDGPAGRTPALALVVLAPLFTAAGAVLLRVFGQVTHRLARALGGIGDRDTTVEVLVLFAAIMALPAAGALLLVDPGTPIATVVDLVLSVAALILGVKVIAYLHTIGQVRATLAVLVPVALFVIMIILLTALHAALLPMLPVDWRVR